MPIKPTVPINAERQDTRLVLSPKKRRMVWQEFRPEVNIQKALNMMLE
ncbi:hypothetical protein H6G77_19315 [Aulosira sp. FACHB-615]|nr:hypothetical protein [Aulosira sp. FACHB-615]